MKKTVLFCCILLLTACQPDGEYASFHWSRDFGDTPQLAAQLIDIGVLGSEKGIIEIEIIQSDGQRFVLDGKPYQIDTSKVEFWMWNKTAGFALAPDTLRDQFNNFAVAHPPDSYLLPGALGPFLIEAYRAAKSAQ